jgi:hypothetical protein
MEETTKCKLLVLTHNGSKSLSSLMLISATSKKQENVLMSIQAEMKKVERLSFGTSTVVLTKDGRLSTKMSTKRSKLRENLKNSDSTLIDHSISDLDTECKELLNALELIILSLRDGERINHNNNSGSTESPRLSDQTTGKTTQWKSNQMAHHILSE